MDERIALLPPGMQRRITISGEHWMWTGGVTHGYGRYDGNRKSSSFIAHRAVWEELGFPPAEHLHHRCRTPLCVNPDHLEPLTAAEHAREHNPRPTHCIHGHEFTPENTYLRKDATQGQMCRRCLADRQLKRYYSLSLDERRARGLAGSEQRRQRKARTKAGIEMDGRVGKRR